MTMHLVDSSINAYSYWRDESNVSCFCFCCLLIVKKIEDGIINSWCVRAVMSSICLLSACTHACITYIGCDRELRAQLSWEWMKVAAAGAKPRLDERKCKQKLLQQHFVYYIMQTTTTVWKKTYRCCRFNTAHDAMRSAAALYISLFCYQNNITSFTYSSALTFILDDNRNRILNKGIIKVKVKRGRGSRRI